MKGKKRFRSIFAFVLTIALVLSTVPGGAFSKAVKADEGTEIGAVEKTVKRQVVNNSVSVDFDSSIGKKDYDRDNYGYISIPDLKLQAGNPSISYQKAKSMLVDDPAEEKGRITGEDYEVPSAFPYDFYDEEGLYNYVSTVLPPVRNQGNTETCWAHTAMCLLENYVIANEMQDQNGTESVLSEGALPGINYSELQLAYYVLHDNSKIFGTQSEVKPTIDDSLDFTYLGNNVIVAANVLIKGIGAVDELVVPFKTKSQFKSEKQRKAQEGINDTLYSNQSDVIRLDNAMYLNMAANTNQIKQAIIENHAVGIAFCANSQYYNAEYNAFYTPEFQYSNHAVTIVGWDDNFPKEYFTGADGNGTLPENDGAWLVRNSWVDTLENPEINPFDYSAYFWMSYEDKGLDDWTYVFEAGESDKYENVYTHSPNAYIPGYLGADIVANVFEIRGEEERIEAVILSTEFADVNYSISIFSVDENGMPSEPIVENYIPTTGTIVFPGNYTIPLVQPVELTESEKYAVVVMTDNGCIDSETEWNLGILDLPVEINPGESFYYEYDDNEWCDVYDLGFGGLGLGNFAIDVLTNNVEEVKKVEGLRVTGRTENSISLSWDEYPGADSYKIFKYTGKGSFDEEATATTIGGLTSTEYTDNGLDDSSHYKYYVIACDGSGEQIGRASRVVAAETCLIEAPDVKAVIYDSDLILSNGWAAVYGPVDDNVGNYFVVYGKTGSEEWKAGETVQATFEGEYCWFFDKNGLEPGEYEMMVFPIVYNLYGEGCIGTPASTTFTARYPKPEIIDTTYDNVQKEITVTWNPVEGASKYIVYSVDEESKADCLGIVSDDSCQFVIDKYYYSDGWGAIRDNEMYYFTVMVYDETKPETDPWDYAFYAYLEIFTEAPEIVSQPQNITAPEGSTVEFNVTADGNDLKYQWQTKKNGGNIWVPSGLPGNKTDSLTVLATAARNGYQFRCIVTDINGLSVTSEAATLTVTSGAKITSQPEDVTTAAGTTAVFKVQAEGTGLKYKWQTSKNSGTTWVDSGFKGYNTDTLNVPVIKDRNGYKFRCIVSDKDGCSVTSEAATLTVTSSTTPDIKITSQPADVTTAVGTTAVFKVQAEGTGLKYKWQTSKNGGQTWVDSGFKGCNTDTLNVPAIKDRNGYKFRCIISDKDGCTVTSEAATLTIGSATDIVITGQPEDVTAAVDSTATFKVTASGTELKYQWQTSKDGGATWVNSGFKGNNTDTLTVPVIKDRNGYKFRCVITDKDGCVVNSNAATLTVTK